MACGVLIHGFLHHGDLLVCISVIHCSPITLHVGFEAGSLCVTISDTNTIQFKTPPRSRRGCVAGAARAAVVLGCRCTPAWSHPRASCTRSAPGCGSAAEHST